MTRPVGGYLVDTPDDRDYSFGYARTTIGKMATTSADLVVLPQTTPISDQGPLSSCVANAACDAVELLSVNPVQLSRLAVYWLARLRHGAECIDDGTYIRHAFHVLSHVGVPREDKWPYDHGSVNVRPSLEALIDAYDHPVSAYYRIDSSGAFFGSDIEPAIRAGFPVVFGVSVGREFKDYDGSEKVFDAPAVSIGGHAMVVTGFRYADVGEQYPVRQYLIRNSWGTSWGLRDRPGHCWFSEDYMQTARDIWVPTVAPLGL